mmetsp:Transcript_14563/g.22447  ORF Transcript_14563/g.22447 Transcript_14563/m.22447 type:complete len:702 (+) Transcript_14563:193-2298(+)|eukprot:CAMPEP_0196825714 /NCGR_PEP_ID=MMETSP1362-20130617/93219_1 /TAXON_ID=163516 /ORGANISM="Leptocylindrus danicus, Strain CCMP1856" /LENGTH=701 /DNA_ID=CAMNT_0042206195 /DNA_START=641 /DNA_END=2746 /DNA_ORIENTATION=-
MAEHVHAQHAHAHHAANTSSTVGETDGNNTILSTTTTQQQQTINSNDNPAVLPLPSSSITIPTTTNNNAPEIATTTSPTNEQDDDESGNSNDTNGSNSHYRSSSRSPLVRQRHQAHQDATNHTTTSSGVYGIRSRPLPRRDSHRNRTRSVEEHNNNTAHQLSAPSSPSASQQEYYWPAFDIQEEDVSLNEFTESASTLPLHYQNIVGSVRNQRAYSDPQVRIEPFFSTMEHHPHSHSHSHQGPSPPVVGDDGNLLRNSSNTTATTTLNFNGRTISSSGRPNNSSTGVTNGNLANDTATIRTSNNGNSNNTNNAAAVNERMERASRWIRVNQCLNCTITLVALVFSLLLFTILVCWVVLTSAYVVSIDKQCDVPLKTYYWFATLQLILDVFRGDIMRHIFHYDAHAHNSTNTRQRNSGLPRRVVAYNIAYIAFAMTVLYSGVKSVFLTDESTCSRTAPELFQTCKVFVVLSIAAWSTVMLVYMIPFFFIALFLTRNGYLPPSTIVERDDMLRGAAGAASLTVRMGGSVGAPPECIERLRVVRLQDFPAHYPKECCICMVDFVGDDVIVATECEHIFHKQCCQEWLRQSRTCPVCRTDIPASQGMMMSSTGGFRFHSDNSDLRLASISAGRISNRQRAGTEGSFTGEDIQREVVDFFRSFQDLRGGSAGNVVAQSSAAAVGASSSGMDSNNLSTGINGVASNV